MIEALLVRLEDTLRRRRLRSATPLNIRTVQSLLNLSRTYLDEGRWSRALSLIREADAVLTTMIIGDFQ